ncbi:MAG: imidazole glycerol phosphate synthase subunit HisH [Bacteroidetes bacterium]|nr:imidazole glycerol phosphate synthase subunit HisH [Bacteroidota bacterium]NCQ11010.1 imidazole glycerol phosphate synthase subunit HisH [Bacteroidota bacterium]
MIGIVDYGSGNIQAIANIYKRLNIECKIINNPAELESAYKLILPGVGAFDECMKQLLESGLKDKLDELVLIKKTPILGICIGMHIMADSSEEGNLKGLGWIKGKVKKFDISRIQSKPYLPHMGWNNISDNNNHKIFDKVDKEQGFYFVHSYYYDCDEEKNVLSTCHYGINFASSIYDHHIFGMQFHPEKSHSNGIQLLENFAKLELC